MAPRSTTKKPPDRREEPEPAKPVVFTKTVKSYLSSVLAGDRAQKSRLTAILEDLVIANSQVAKRASLLLNAALTKACESSDAWTLKDESELMTIFNQCGMIDDPEKSSYVRAMRSLTSFVQAAYRDMAGDLNLLNIEPDVRKRINMTVFRSVRTSSARAYAANFFRDLWYRLESRFSSYLSCWWTAHKPAAKSKWPKGTVGRACRFFIRGTEPRTPLPEGLREWVLAERASIKATDDDVLDETWVRAHVPQVVRYLHRVLGFYDQLRSNDAETGGLGNRCRARPFTLAPVHRTRRLFVHLDSTTFFEILRRMFPGFLSVPPAVMAVGAAIERVENAKEALEQAEELVRACKRGDPQRAGLVTQRDRLRQEVQGATRALADLKADQKKEAERRREEILKEKVREWEARCDKARKLNKPIPPQPVRARASKELLERLGLDDIGTTPFQWYQRHEESAAWARMFAVKKPDRESKWSFANHVSTDAVSAGLAFQRTVPAASARANKEEAARVFSCNLGPELAGFDRVVYVDPGRTFLVTAV